MKSSASKIKMPSYDDAFKVSPNLSIANNSHLGKFTEVPIVNLNNFKNHPFKVLNDEKMQEIKESIEKNGVLVPIIVRPTENDNYEIIAGHRRKYACDLLGKKTIPAIIKDLDDEEATIIMVDSNIQRENLLFSEKAFAFKMRLEAIKRKAGRPKKNSGQVGENLYSIDKISENANESSRNIQRYIRLTELITELLDMVDSKKIAFNTAVELSYLKVGEQEMILSKIQELELIPSMVQASEFKKYSNQSKLTLDIIDGIMNDSTVKPVQITLKSNKLNKYFPKDTTSEEIEKVIIELLENWKTIKN